jgi:hypothetical protein
VKVKEVIYVNKNNWEEYSNMANLTLRLANLGRGKSSGFMLIEEAATDTWREI